MLGTGALSASTFCQVEVETVGILSPLGGKFAKHRESDLKFTNQKFLRTLKAQKLVVGGSY